MSHGQSWSREQREHSQHPEHLPVTTGCWESGYIPGESTHKHPGITAQSHWMVTDKKCEVQRRGSTKICYISFGYTYAAECVWRLEDSLFGSVLPVCGVWDRTQVSKLGCKYLCPLNHPFGPSTQILNVDPLWMRSLRVSAVLTEATSHKPICSATFQSNAETVVGCDDFVIETEMEYFAHMLYLTI